MVTPLLIGIAGSTASGKTTVAAFLEEKYGAYRTRYAAVLQEIADLLDLDQNDKPTLQRISTLLREGLGEDTLTTALQKRVSEVDTNIIVIEGNRRKVDAAFLENLALATDRKLLLLFIDASVETRFKRYNERETGLGKEETSHEAFMKMENDECESEIGELREIFKEKGTILDTDTLSREEVIKTVTELIEENK